MPLTQQTVMITGANRGLGQGLARAFLADNYRVIAVNRSTGSELDNIESDSLEVILCDLTDDLQLDGLATTLSGRTIDVLINNAGMMAKPGFSVNEAGTQGFGHFDRTLWHRLFDINLFTPMKMAELLIENIARAERGRIVTISSLLGSMEMNTFGGLYAYRASKAGVNAIMKSMAVDLADRGIISIAQHPGWVRTDMGGSDADLDIQTSVNGMKNVIENLTLEDSGRFISYDGSEMPW
jgi:NAD(P)-dependent dehydrogenase (short-subunit alcohol dehydrogenase family)